MKFMLYAIITLATLFGVSSVAQEVSCVDVNGERFCKTNNMIGEGYKRLQLSDIKPNTCYKSVLQQNIVFYRVKEVKNKTIFAFSQKVPKSNPQSLENKIYIDQFRWESHNFNETLTQYPCSETPQLQETYMVENCLYRNQTRGTLYCNPPRRYNNFERKYN